jgi:hypothetical protein
VASATHSNTRVLRGGSLGACAAYRAVRWEMAMESGRRSRGRPAAKGGGARLTRHSMLPLGVPCCGSCGARRARSEFSATCHSRLATSSCVCVHTRARACVRMRVKVCVHVCVHRDQTVSVSCRVPASLRTRMFPIRALTTRVRGMLRPFRASKCSPIAEEVTTRLRTAQACSGSRASC